MGIQICLLNTFMKQVASPNDPCLKFNAGRQVWLNVFQSFVRVCTDLPCLPHIDAETVYGDMVRPIKLTDNEIMLAFHVSLFEDPANALQAPTMQLSVFGKSGSVSLGFQQETEENLQFVRSVLSQKLMCLDRTQIVLSSISTNLIRDFADLKDFVQRTVKFYPDDPDLEIFVELLNHYEQEILPSQSL